MILKELIVNNYRPFLEERFSLSPQVTVIAGVNGRGKSSVLDALALLLSRLLPQVTPASGGYKYLGPRDIHSNEQLLQLTLTATFEDIPVNFSIAYETGGRQRVKKLLPQVRQEILRIYGDPGRAGDEAPIAVYYTTDRASYRMPKKLLRGLTQDQSAAYHGALFNRQVDFRDFMSRYANWATSVTAGEDVGRNRRTVDLIERVVLEFLPGFSNVRVEMEPLRLLVSKNDEVLDLSQLSDGERSLFAVLIDLCRRLVLANPDLADPSQGAGVVLIDEIELHLHPTWQRGIVENLRQTFPHIQFVLTTHSPFVIQSVREGELIRLDHDEDELVAYADRSIEDIAENVMGIDVPQKSQRYADMIEAAEQYFEMLRRDVPAEGHQLAELKVRLDELAEPFSDDAAFQALLRVERTALLGGDA